MSKDEIIPFLLSILVLVVFMGGCHIGCKSGSEGSIKKFQREAVTNGHAEYKVDEKGDPVWQWKESK